MDIINDIGLTGMIPFTYFGGSQKPVGSTLLRIDNLATVSNHFEKWIHGRKYDNLIFQKAYWKEMMELFEGPKILDICDPDWLIEDVNLVEISNLIHAFTCSSEGLRNLLKTYFPDKLIVHVPDRINPAMFPKSRGPHMGKAKKLVWFGFIHNAHESLIQLLPTITKYNLKLTLISDKPYSNVDGILELNPEFIEYQNETAYEHIKKADIVLNPKSDKAFFKYKSNNKTIISWKLGLPVAENVDDIERFLDPVERNEEVSKKQVIVNREYNIQRSADQYMDLIRLIKIQNKI